MILHNNLGPWFPWYGIQPCHVLPGNIIEHKRALSPDTRETRIEMRKDKWTGSDNCIYENAPKPFSSLEPEKSVLYCFWWWATFVIVSSISQKRCKISYGPIEWNWTVVVDRSMFGPEIWWAFASSDDEIFAWSWSMLHDRSIDRLGSDRGSAQRKTFGDFVSIFRS